MIAIIDGYLVSNSLQNSTRSSATFAIPTITSYFPFSCNQHRVCFKNYLNIIKTQLEILENVIRMKHNHQILLALQGKGIVNINNGNFSHFYGCISRTLTKRQTFVKSNKDTKVVAILLFCLYNSITSDQYDS